MGIFLSRTWFIYARDKSDRWMEPLASTLSNEEDVEFHMARFKHYVFLLGLDNLDAEISKIYLYQNRRVAKCVKSGSEIVVDFSSKEAAFAWTSCKRSKKGRKFDSLYHVSGQTDLSVTFSSSPGSQSVVG
jgi:hypothetical protein